MLLADTSKSRGGSRRVTRVTSHPLARQPISCYYYALKKFIHF